MQEMSLCMFFPIHQYDLNMNIIENNLNNAPENKTGMTLVEVMITMAITVLVSGGIYAGGIAALRLAQTNRIMTEAHAFAKEGLEEIIASGYEKFRGGSIPNSTNFIDNASHNVTIIRSTDIILHAADKTVVTNATGVTGGYAEVYVHASFNVPGTSRNVKTSITTILQ